MFIKQDVYLAECFLKALPHQVESYREERQARYELLLFPWLLARTALEDDKVARE